MRFEIQPPFVLVHDSKPGSHATLFGTHSDRYGKGVVRYPFRSDQSHFSDAETRYSWAFEATPADGEVLVFATSDRELVGEVHGLDVTPHQRHPLGMSVYRVAAAGDKPVTLL